MKSKDVFRTSAGDGEDYPERSPQPQEGPDKDKQVSEDPSDNKQAKKRDVGTTIGWEYRADV